MLFTSAQSYPSFSTICLALDGKERGKAGRKGGGEGMRVGVRRKEGRKEREEAEREGCQMPFYSSILEGL